MTLIEDSLRLVLPPRKKSTASGWISFNAVCCHHRGESPDRRQRGGVLFTDQGFQYHCFNCGFKAGWSQGKLLSRNTQQLFQWLGMNQTVVNELAMSAIRQKDSTKKILVDLDLTLEERRLPPDSRSLIEWAENPISEDLIKVLEYLVDRGMELDWYPWHWSPSDGFRDRLLIPFYDQGRIVGYTARKITDSKPKYLSDSQSGYVFNLDRQHTSRQYTIVVEGPLDAIALDAAAILTNEPNQRQIHRLQQLNRQIIVVPDRDPAGMKIIDHAVMNNWALSLPPWPETVKDVADAVKQWGRIYTLNSIIHHHTTNPIKIDLARRHILGRL